MTRVQGTGLQQFEETEERRTFRNRGLRDSSELKDVIQSGQMSKKPKQTQERS